MTGEKMIHLAMSRIKDDTSALIKAFTFTGIDFIASSMDSKICKAEQPHIQKKRFPLFKQS